MDYRGYVDLLCSTEDCRSELEEVLRVFVELLDDVKELRLPELDVDPSRLPLLAGGVRGGLEGVLEIVKDIFRRHELDVGYVSIRDVMEGSLEGERALVSMLFKRALYEVVRGKDLRLQWVNGRCPVCGSLPILAIVRRERGEIFSRDVLYLRCTCGFTESYEHFKCPSCGVRGRDAFEYNIVGEITYRTCSRCGHTIGILKDNPNLDLDLIMLVVMYGLVALAKERL